MSIVISFTRKINSFNFQYKINDFTLSNVNSINIYLYIYNIFLIVNKYLIMHIYIFLDAVQMVFSNTTIKEIELMTSIWLTKAPDRLKNKKMLNEYKIFIVLYSCIIV